MKPLVSVVITTFNHIDYVRGAINSVLRQTYSDIEIIVVDDGSSDDTKEALAQYVDAGKIHYVYQDNKGLSAARNTGLTNAKGPYVKFLDSDDWLYGDQIKKQMEDLLAAKDPMLMSMSNFCMIGPSGNIQDIDVPMVGPDKQLEHYIVSNRGAIHSFIFPTDLVKNTGGFDTDLRACEDLDLKLRLILGGARVLKNDYNGCCYRLSENSMSNDALHMFLEKCKVYEKLNKALRERKYHETTFAAEPLKYKNLLMISECIARKLSLKAHLPQTLAMTRLLYEMCSNRKIKCLIKYLGFKKYLIAQFLYRTKKDKHYKNYLLNQEISWKIP